LHPTTDTKKGLPKQKRPISPESQERMTDVIERIKRQLDGSNASVWIVFMDLVQIHGQGSQKEYIFPVTAKTPTEIGSLSIYMINPVTVRIINRVKKDSHPVFIEVDEKIKIGKYFVGVFDTKVQAKIWHFEMLDQSRPNPNKNRRLRQKPKPGHTK